MHTKIFRTHDEYEQFINGGQVSLPNVSVCDINNEVHYNKGIEDITPPPGVN